MFDLIISLIFVVAAVLASLKKSGRLMNGKKAAEARSRLMRKKSDSPIPALPGQAVYSER